MRNTITVMNAKGGVGKSTLVLALAELWQRIIARACLSSTPTRKPASAICWRAPARAPGRPNRGAGRGLPHRRRFEGLQPKLAGVRVPDVSDVDDARSISLIASDTDLTLFERRFPRASTRRGFALPSAPCWRKRVKDTTSFSSTAPGLSVLTECFLREADFYVSPTRPDYISTRGLGFRREFLSATPRWVSPESRCHHQHEGPAVAGGRAGRSVAQAGCRAPLLP